MSDPLDGLDLSDEERAMRREAFRAIAAEIEKLAELDLADIHPAVVFDATAGTPR